MTREKINEALIIVDVQNDFCPGGKLAVAEGDQVVEPINKLLERGREKGWLLLASRDYHPADTTHFADFGGVWPVHCVQETIGAEFHKNLLLGGDITVITKGTGRDENAYSAFDGKTPMGVDLETFLRSLRIGRIYVAGLATDYCVKETAIGAAKRGFETIVLRDAVKAVNLNLDEKGNKRLEGTPTDENLAFAQMVEAGVKFTITERVTSGLI